MLRLGVAFGLALSIVGPAAAFAQAPVQATPMPIALDLAKVQVGSWADYSMTMGKLPPMKMRMALVAKAPGANVIESAVEGGLVGAAGKMVMHISIAPGANFPVKQVVMQLGAADPMELPLEMAGGKPFTRPNPKSLIGSEMVKVSAGSFKAKHYREKTPQGDRFEYWVSDGAPPLGIVKVEVDQKNNPSIKGVMGFELLHVGKDAKPLVTKPAKPYDQAVLMQQLMAGGAGAGGPGAAKPAPTPAPAPGPKK
jgi:hypothetical protein